MKGFLRLKKRDSYLIITFSIIIFTLSVCISIIYSEIIRTYEKNGVDTGNSKYFNFIKPENVNTNQMVELIEKNKNINVYIEYNPIPIYKDVTTLFGKAIFSNKDYNFIPPILDGRYFSLPELSSSENIVVLGNNLKQYIEPNGKFKIEGKEFNVIGIMGYDNGKSAYDEMFIIPMKSVNVASDSRCQWKVVGDNNTIDHVLNLIQDSIISDNNKIIFKEPIYQIDIREIILSMWDFISVFLLASIIGILNIFMMMQFWIKGYKKEIGVRKALGGTNTKIVVEILIKYQILLGISFVIGASIHYITQGIFNDIFSYVDFKYTINNIIIVYLATMILGLIVGVFPIIKALFTNPSISIKGVNR